MKWNEISFSWCSTIRRWCSAHTKRSRVVVIHEITNRVTHTHLMHSVRIYLWSREYCTTIQQREREKKKKNERTSLRHKLLKNRYRMTQYQVLLCCSRISMERVSRVLNNWLNHTDMYTSTLSTHAMDVFARAPALFLFLSQFDGFHHNHNVRSLTALRHSILATANVFHTHFQLMCLFHV